MVLFIEPLARGSCRAAFGPPFGFCIGVGSAFSVSHGKFGSVGSERSRSLAGRWERFNTDKTLLLAESGTRDQSTIVRADNRDRSWTLHERASLGLGRCYGNLVGA